MILLGCIADDFTGGSDLAGTLVKRGMRTALLIGIPTTPPPPDVDAIVIALKSRTSPVAEAVGDSVAALRWLRSAGCRQIYFKYCSTFDSTDIGNIGPVSEALMNELGTDFTIVCPAFPANLRTVYMGHLFVGRTLLSESNMRSHPLTPMRDADLVRVLQRQVTRPVGLIEHGVVTRGSSAIATEMSALRRQGYAFAVVDSIGETDLLEIGEACADLSLVTGASGAALGLPANFRRRGLLDSHEPAETLPVIRGLRAVIAGSCSAATNAQVRTMRESNEAFAVDPRALANGETVVKAALEWASTRLSDAPVLIYATANPDDVRSIQAELGVEEAGVLVEGALAEIAVGLVDLGVRQLIIAGGETSGAVVAALGVRGLLIGPEIDPGVPWTASIGTDRSLAFALKSGNFGTPDFFMKAWGVLDDRLFAQAPRDLNLDAALPSDTRG